MSLPSGEVVRFAVTGLAAYLTDVAVFNVLLLGAGMSPTWSKVLSSVAAIAVAFAGSRFYTWRDRRTDSPGREYALFVFFSALAAGIQLACLLVSHELLGLRSPVADNVSANVVGMALATAFRFYTFRTYVFPPRAPVPAG
ncbi:MAG: GtrA family protein [Mycobacteriales bacterium]